MDGQQTDGALIGEVAKNSKEIIRVQRTQYNGHDLIDVRVYAVAVTPGEESKPTKKGLCLRPEVWRELLGVLQGELRE